MQHKQPSNNEKAQSHEAKPRMAGQLLSEVPVEVHLQPGEQLDIFTGTQSAMERADNDDPSRFSVIDLRGAERSERGGIIYEGQELSPHLEYLITQPSTPIDWQAGKGYKGLRRGEVVDMGRNQDAVKDRFDFTNRVSRHHFTVAVDNEGVLMLEDGGSTNGTSYQTKDTAANTTETSESLSPEEKKRQAYLRELFLLPERKGKDRFGNDLDRRLKVTEESNADAAMAYRFTDHDIKDIVSQHARENYDGVWREEHMAAMIYKDEALRMKLGEHLLEKLKTDKVKRRLPSRFYGTSTKNPNYAGYQNMTSHEYAAVLAISMLDGTFKTPGPGDPIESDYGQIVSGQHRYAAMRLLGIDSSPVAKIRVKR